MQSRLKQSSADLLVVQVKARYPHKPDAFLRDVVSRRLQDGEPMTEDEVNGIVTYMYNEHDADAILGQLHDIRCGKGVCVRPCVLACACVRVRACVRVSVFLCTCVHKGGGAGDGGRGSWEGSALERFVSEVGTVIAEVCKSRY